MGSNPTQGTSFSFPGADSMYLYTMIESVKFVGLRTNVNVSAKHQ